MNIGLIDVDGHNFPNLALMKISAYHKALGDHVEWWFTDFVHYDIVYMSKVFSSTYSGDIPEPMNCDLVIKGGTGYCIETVNGVEIFNKDKHVNLNSEIEKMYPDYSLYPQYNFAVCMTSRGCPRNCKFCHVGKKEGCKAVKVSNVLNFWNGQKRIECLDANITACPEKRDLFRQYKETNAEITFNQGLDIRLVNDDDINDLNSMKIRNLHFAWDNVNDPLECKFKYFSENFRRKYPGVVYVLVNYDSTMEENLFRIYTLRKYNYRPYVMIYNKPSANKDIKALQRWCNNYKIFGKCERFEDYYSYIPQMRYKKNYIIPGQIALLME